MQDRWAKFGDELLRSGRADEALTCYDRAARELRAPAPVPPAGQAADHGRKLALGGRLDEAAAWYGLRRRDDRPVDVARGEVVVCSVVRNEVGRLPYFALTRACLEVCVETANPAAFITKSPLIERDVELLAALGRVAAAHVTVSIPIWDPVKARVIEPYVATPLRRIHIIEKLARAGVEVGVNVAPVIPGLNDQDIPKVLAAAREAGATHAGFVLLRLPGSVKAVFEERLRAGLPLQAERVLHRIRETRGGALYDARFGVRGRGDGNYALAIETLFRATAARLGFRTHG